MYSNVENKHDKCISWMYSSLNITFETKSHWSIQTKINLLLLQRIQIILHQLCHY